MKNSLALHDEGWQATADRAQLYRDPTAPERKKKLAAALAALAKGSRVVDFGCGRAEFTEYIASLGFKAVGVDLSPAAVELNRRDFPQLEFVVADLDQPAPLADQYCEALWCSEVIEHVYDVHGVFAEFERLLKPGGLLVLTTPYHGWLKNLLVITFGFEQHFSVEWQHIRFWTRKSLTKVAAAHGLRALRWDSVGRIPWLAKSFFVTFQRTT